MDLKDDSMLVWREPTTTIKAYKITYELEVLADSSGLKRLIEARELETKTNVCGYTGYIKALSNVEFTPDLTLVEITLVNSY